jgi:uncharacterized protein with von Willebrand factor type A (vWA) domain
MADKWHGGKGDKRRPEDKKKFDENFERIFGKKRPNANKEKDSLYFQNYPDCGNID